MSSDSINQSSIYSLGFPYWLYPTVPLKQVKINKTIAPIYGIKTIKYQAPDLF
jgi:hypothetical protein